MLIVSHDARLLTMTNCEMWLMDNQTVKPIEGGYEAYRDSLLKEMEFVGEVGRCECRATTRTTNLSRRRTRSPSRSSPP